MQAPPVKEIISKRVVSASPPGVDGQPPLDTTSENNPDFTYLRQLRAEIQDLQSLLGGVQRGEVQLKDYVAYLQRTLGDIGKLMAEIRILSQDDGTRHIFNMYEQMVECPLLKAPTHEYGAEELLRHLNLLNGLFKKMIAKIGELTIPDRLNTWLKTARSGYYIPFHTVFEDEVPDAEDRTRILNRLAFAPDTIYGGLVSVGSGLIYRYSLEQSWLRLTVLGVLGILLVSVGILLGLARLVDMTGPILGWTLKPEHFPMLLGGWLAVLSGVAIHMVVNIAKRYQAEGALPPIIAVGDFFYALNAYLGPLVLKLALALIGVLALTFIQGPDSVKVLDFFLLGYTLDSFIGLLDTTASQRGAAQIAKLKEQLSV